MLATRGRPDGPECENAVPGVGARNGVGVEGHDQAAFDEQSYSTPESASIGSARWTVLEELRAEFCDLAGWSPAWADYVHGHALDLAMVEAHAGAIGVCRVRFLPGRRFDFAPDGRLAAVIEAFGADDDRVLDLVAWPVERPDKFATALGRAVGLGHARVESPATYHGGRPLRVFRTPLGWLQAGCQGAVILDPDAAPGWLPDALGPIAGEDIDHAREIARLLRPYVQPRRIVAPIRRAA